MQKVFLSCLPLDKKCYELYSLTEDLLTEHAAMGMATYILDHFPPNSSILIVAGNGNNGADGIALARLLFKRFDVRLYVPFGVTSFMAEQQLLRTQNIGVVPVQMMKEADVIVDALFGAGLNRPLNLQTQEMITQLNSFDGFKIACDIPTGIQTDGRVVPIAFCADVTLTMGAYKEALFLDISKDSIGEIHRIDLGVENSLYEDKSDTFVLEFSDLKLPSRTLQSTHKGNFGHAVVFAGDKEGAGIIAGSAATRFGAGLTTLVVGDEILVPPYLMHSKTLPTNATAIAIGMGLGDAFDTSFFEKNILNSTLPIVLDADALHSELFLKILEQTNREIILTPHPKEFSVLWKILAGESYDVATIQERRFEMVRKFSTCYPHATLLLKGANMLIVHQGKLYINPLGSSVLSKGGSGDVLSGLIVSLLAQGYRGIDATIHASIALTLASKNYNGSSYAMLPIDLIDHIAQLEKDKIF